MATEDEVRRLILEVIGEDKVRSLRERIDEEKQSLLSLTSALSHLAPEELARDKGVQLATQHLAEMNQELVKLGGRHRDLGYAALEASRAFEDLQYGIGGVINNIPGLVMALGGGAGVTAAISALAVVGNQLVKHFFPDWEGGVKKVKEEHEKLTEAMKEQLKALKALEEAKPKAEGVEGVIGANREQMRKAVAAQLGAEDTAEEQRLTGALDKLDPYAPGWAAESTRLLKLYDRVQKRKGTGQLRADEMLGRAAQGGLVEQGRLRGIFGPDTEIGARLAEAGPDRTAQREQDDRDVEQQKRMHRLDEQIARQKEHAAQKSGQLMGQAFEQEEQDLGRQHQADQHSAQQKRQADQREEQAKHRSAAAAEQKARQNERDFIEDIRLKADQAIAGGAPAGMVGAQAAAMFAKMAATNGQTTNLAQAQARMMLHLQQVQERQERQNQETERKVQQFWDNAFRHGK